MFVMLTEYLHLFFNLHWIIDGTMLMESVEFSSVEFTHEVLVSAEENFKVNVGMYDSSVK